MLQFHHDWTTRRPKLKAVTRYSSFRQVPTTPITTTGLKMSASSLITGTAFAGTASQFLRLAISRFLLDWKTYSLIPIVAALVGWFTNYLAVQMIFFPIQWRGLQINFSRARRRKTPEYVANDKQRNNNSWRIGWQGIVPAKTAKMSEAMVNVTINELLSMEETILKLSPQKVADIVSPQVPEMMYDVVDNKNNDAPVVLSPLFQSVARGVLLPGQQQQPENNHTTLPRGGPVNGFSHRVVQDWFGRRLLQELTRNMQADILNLFHVRDCVVSQMMADRSLLGKLFQETGGQELDFLVNSGLWFGFVLGIVQMLLALWIGTNSWALGLVGGLVVGLATNWLALKWIFEPVTPVRIGPLTLQGLFLKRQAEVAKDFSNFFATRILNSKEMWSSILTEASTKVNFRNMFVKSIENILPVFSKDTAASNGNKDFLNAAVARIMKRLPYHFETSNFHAYVDETLEIESTLRTGLENMSSKEFEQVLHPIFEEDELTLILAGGFLGFAAGFIQQLLATGVLKLPSLASLVALVSTATPVLKLGVGSVGAVGGVFWLLWKERRWRWNKTPSSDEEVSSSSPLVGVAASVPTTMSHAK